MEVADVVVLEVVVVSPAVVLSPAVVVFALATSPSTPNGIGHHGKGYQTYRKFISLKMCRTRGSITVPLDCLLGLNLEKLRKGSQHQGTLCTHTNKGKQLNTSIYVRHFPVRDPGLNGRPWRLDMVNRLPCLVHEISSSF